MYFLLPLLESCPLRGHPCKLWLGVTGQGAHGYGLCKLLVKQTSLTAGQALTRYWTRWSGLYDLQPHGGPANAYSM